MHFSLEKIRKVPKKIWSYIFSLSILTFFVIYLRNIDFSKLENIRINWVYFGLATLFGLIFRFWGVFIWRSIIKDLGNGKLPPFADMSYIYSKAWMGRYIPGTVAWIAGKVYMASQYGIPKGRLVVSSLLEGVMQIAAMMSISLLLIGIDSRLDLISWEIKGILFATSSAFLILLIPSVFNSIIKHILKIIRKDVHSESLQITGKAVFRSYFLYSIGIFISGTSVFLLTLSIQEQVGIDLYFYLVGSFSLSGALGMAVPLVPSGIGVREGALLILLRPIFTPENALLIAVVTRIWGSFADVIFFAVSFIILKFKTVGLTNEDDVKKRN